jgi:hypothetical protein
MYVITGRASPFTIFENPAYIYLFLKTGSSIVTIYAAAGTAVPREIVGG